MPSAALARWRNNRLFRLGEVDAHCATIQAVVPPNPTFLDESLRGFVLHLSAHFQGCCRDLYTESAQALINGIPAPIRTAAQSQFLAHLSLERGNPSYENIKRDFNRFGLILDLARSHPACRNQITDLAHLIDWRNRAAHQGQQPLGGGVPSLLTLGLVRTWVSSCSSLVSILDDLMHTELSMMLGAPPW